MRRTLASILCITLFFGMMAIFNLPAAGATDGSYFGMGDYTAHLQADPQTDTAPSDFGTTDANGKVWTDKSVTVDRDRFEITLSALAQEYISTGEGTATSSTAADVVMILDVSASMQQNTLTLDGETMTRTKAMVRAVNEALELIMAANENNRVLIYTYQSNSDGSAPVTSELLPLGHYTNDSWTKKDVWSDSSGKYFTYSTSGNSGVVKSASGLKKDGTAISQKSISTALGTCTQHGIFKGVQALATSIAAETKTTDRKPYVLLFTDGAPGNANKTWYSTTTTSCSFSHENSGSAEISALTILSAAYMKNTLNTAYHTYNGKDMGIEWFNIGLGVGSNAYGTLFLQPANLATDTSSESASIRDYISTYTSGKYSSYASYATNYTYTVDAYIVNQGDELNDAFKALAEKVEEETKTITSPIINAEGATDDLTFTDTIGAGMKVDRLALHPDKNTEVLGVKSGNTYTFAGYDTVVALSTDLYSRQVLTWQIPADEVAIFSFANRSAPTDGTYIAADPIRLTYTVEAADKAGYAGQTFYSNQSATARFSIPNDNTFYYEEGVLKTAPFAALPKSENISGLSANHTEYTTALIQDGATVTALLGNNGKLSPATQLIKSAEEQRVEAGTAAAFALAVTNKSGAALTDLAVRDTLPDGLTYLEGSAENAAIAASGDTLTFTIDRIDAGQTVTVTYRAVLKADAANGSTYENTAAVTHINEIEVYGPVDSSATVTAYQTYKVNYIWSGTVPDGASLPIDPNRYTVGAYYAVDTAYTEHTKIEKKDAFGNVTERWAFSGWADPNHGQMGQADVTVEGVWSYEAFTYPAHRVFYTWSGDVPAGKVLPTDGNSYVKNQPYTVDSTYTAATVLEIKDAFGNVSGKYTFSGWADPNRGVMGDEDITIPGVWTYTPVAVEPHRVLYTWTGDIPEGKQLPTDGNSYVPNQTYSVDGTYTHETEILTYDAYGNVNGRYTFSGWTDPNGGVMGHADVTIPGVWTFEAVDVPTHRVFYLWSGEVPPAATLPTDGNSYYENQPYGVDGTYTDATAIPTYDAYGNMNGRYTFSGWTDPNNGVMGTADVTVRGVWEYHSIQVPAHRVHYVWTGEIPTGVLIPADGNTYVKNQTYTVDGTYTAATAILTYDAYGNLNGRYTFSGWNDPNGGVMGDADITIPGVWEYESLTVPTHRVFYTWSGTVPPTQTLPTDGNEYVKNQPYTVDGSYSSATVLPTYDAFGNMNGRYTFSGWNDPNGGVMGDADVTIPGVWEYESLTVPTHRVFYTWSGTVPAGQTLPADANAYVKNQPYAVDSTYTSATLIPTYDAFGNINGKYTFSGWADPNGGVMGDTDITIPGVWTFETVDVPAHRVLYLWTGTVPPTETLPTDANAYVKDQTYPVDTKYTAETELLIYDAFGNVQGRYSFSGWTDPQGGIMGDADVTIPGVWTFESQEISAHRVFYVWSGEVPPEATLPTDGNTYVQNQPYTVDTAYTSQTEVLTYDTAGNVSGKYTFSGWTDPNNGKMGNEDITIPGVWNYQKSDAPAETPPTQTPPADTPAPSNPNTGEIPLELIFLMWLVSSVALIVLGIFRKKISK